MPNPKIVAFDIESSNLSGNFGFILCIGYKYVGEGKPTIIKISDFPLFKKDSTNDREVVKAIYDVLVDADAWLGHYSTRFDVPFINSRLIYHGLKPLPPMTASTHIDTWRISRNHLKLNSNRLDTIAKFLEVKDQKTALSGPIWIRAMAGHKPSLDYVYKHCYYDVLCLEQVYEKIKSLYPDHFNVNIVTREFNNCPRCGKGPLVKRGYYYAKTTQTARYNCKGCGAWSRGKPERMELITR